MDPAPSFPPAGQFLRAIRESSRALREGSQISITQESIHRLLSSPAFILSFKRVSTLHGLVLPLKFPSFLSELNVISVLSLLNFASGYRVPLHTETGRGAWDCIRALVLSLYLESSTNGDLLSAKGISLISEAKVAELMRVNVYVEKAHAAIPGVMMGELGGPLYDLVKLITTTLNETGRILVNSRYPDLGTFVIECLKEGQKCQNPENENAAVEVILERLVRAFPAFQDMAMVNEKPIYCFKKALFLIHAIRVRFGSMNPPPFFVPSTAHLPVFSDNVLPSLLIHLGVIDLSDSPLCRLFPGAGMPEDLRGLLSSPPPSDESEVRSPPIEGPILTRTEAYILRAAAIDACELMVAQANSHNLVDDSDQALPTWLKDIRLPDLDMWIWAVAKDRVDYRRLPRFVLRDTVFF